MRKFAFILIPLALLSACYVEIPGLYSGGGLRIDLLPDTFKPGDSFSLLVENTSEVKISGITGYVRSDKGAFQISITSLRSGERKVIQVDLEAESKAEAFVSGEMENGITVSATDESVRKEWNIQGHLSVDLLPDTYSGTVVRFTAIVENETNETLRISGYLKSVYAKELSEFDLPPGGVKVIGFELEVSDETTLVVRGFAGGKSIQASDVSVRE